MAFDQPFTQWLKQRRKALDLTQQDLAARVGCAVVTIQKLEEGRRRPSKQVATLLATQLGIATAEHPAFLQFARHDQMILTSTPPSPFAAPTRPTNLPTPLTALIGRATEVAAITNALQRPDIRLVTLVGPPGVGKTRLGIRAAEQVAAQFSDGVWFVDLAPLTEAALVLPTIAYVLAIAEAGATPLLARLSATLVDQHLLLILDNCEQVSAAASEIGALLRGCKGLKILATSAGTRTVASNLARLRSRAIVRGACTSASARFCHYTH